MTSWQASPNTPRRTSGPVRSSPWGYLSLSRLHHRLPGCKAHSEVVQATTEFHHQIADAFLPQAEPVFDDAATLDTTVDMLNAPPTLVERLVCPVLRLR